MNTPPADNLLSELDGLNAQQLRRLLAEHLTRRKLGLYWEASAIARDAALNANVVLPRLRGEWSHVPAAAPIPNLIIEGDNFDALRLLKATHAGKIRVIYIDPPYNTGNKDWVYNDRYVGANDRWRHSQWLEFLYRRLLLARDLLTPDGVILVSINDENRARLELLMDEVFPGMRVGSFVWRSRTGGNDTKGAFFSTNHEHVLVYANEGFQFSGDEKTYSIYKHEEAGRIFYLSDLTKAHDSKERPNTFYPIYDPIDDVWYPCNPNRVWAYASKYRIKQEQKLRGDTMEDLIEHAQVWFPPDQRIAVFASEDALLQAIDSGDVPFSGSTPLLTRETPSLHEWVGRRIGYGRPRLKKYKDGLKNENSPISSWLTPRQEEDTADERLNMPIVGTTEEGSRILKEVMGDKAFPYPKPLSLIKNLLSQATRPGDTVLDFFAGSGTTGQAVLELNAEDGGRRRFILCSSTEATAQAPDKNLCRDVCAERLRRVIQGYGGRPGFTAEQGGAFAYVQLDLLEPADAPFEATAEHAFLLLGLQRLGGVRPPPGGAVQWLGRLGDCDVLVCPAVNAEVAEALAA
ncbi:MAG: site-specific DNA-methyltransferase, partial [Candidatus Methylumidiphilus sp.]